MPVGVGNCVMNRICRRFEDAFDGYVGRHNATARFDYRIMKNESEYSASQYNAVKKLYDDFNKRIRNYAVFANYERINDCDSMAEMSMMNEEFKRECSIACPNQDALCNIVLDLCYAKSSTKKFAWSMCGHDIIHNLLLKNNSTISFPVIGANGDIQYGGYTFAMKEKRIEVTE